VLSFCAQRCQSHYFSTAPCTKAKTDKLKQGDRTKYYVKNSIAYFSSHTIFMLKTIKVLI